MAGEPAVGAAAVTAVRRKTIVETLQDPALFGGLETFRDLSTWRVWIVFLSALYGLPMDDEQLAIFRRHTGRTTPREGGYPEAVCIVGRQAGKTQVAGVLATYAAINAPKEPGKPESYALMVSQDQRGASRAILRYATAPFEVLPLLKGYATGQTAESLTLKNGVVLAAYPCRPAAVRGLRAQIVILDELAFFLSSEGNAVDTEMLRAVRPCLATTRGKLVVITSPYGQTGAVWNLHQAHYGRDGSAVLVWQATAPEMNPTLAPDYLERMRAEDPEAAAAEIDGEFRRGLSTLLSPEAIAACVVPDRRELPPVGTIVYRAFVDASGGSSDPMTLAIGHRDGDRQVIDVLRAWPAPFNPDDVVAEACDVLRAYSVRQVTGDAYAGEWPRERFRLGAHEPGCPMRHRRGDCSCPGPWRVGYEVSSENRSELYLGHLLPGVNAGRVQLLDLPELLRELRALVRSRGHQGRDRVDHPRRAGAHDDRANAVAGVLSLLPAAMANARRRPTKSIAPRTVEELHVQEIHAALRRNLDDFLRPPRRRRGAYRNSGGAPGL